MGKQNKDKNRSPGLDWIDSMSGKNRDLEERYGVESVSFGGRPGESSQREAFGKMKSYKDDLVEGFRKDYDARRTLEAAAMSGKKKAQDILDSGFKNISDIRNAQNFFEKAAKRHGQGGDFSNPSDYMGLTRSMVNRDRRKFTEDIEGMIADATTRDENGGDSGPKIERWAGGKSYNDFMAGTFGEERADEISRGWVGETAKATSGFSAGAQEGAGVETASPQTDNEAAAQGLLAQTVKNITGLEPVTDYGKLKQGQYVLENLNGIYNV